MSGDDAPALAERALALAAGEQAQVTVRDTAGRLTRFDGDGADDERESGARTVSFLVLRAGHPGAADATDGTDAALAAAVQVAVDRAEAAARQGGAEGPHPGLPAPAPVREHAGHDPATARQDTAATAAVIAAARAAAAARSAELVAIWATRAATTAIASTAGLRLAEHTTRARLEVQVRDPATGTTQAAAGVAASAAAVNPAAITDRALALLLPGAPTDLDPGPLPVVLGPEAVGALLAVLARTAFDGLAHAEGRGALCGRLGRRVAAPAINLSDSPRFAATLPQSFDLDGVPKAPVPLIQDGVAHRVLHDLRSAARAGGPARSTGHATAPGGASDGPRAGNLVLIGGGATDLAELCAPVARGLLVPRLTYDTAFDPADHAPPATARGAVLVEHGRPTRPVAELQLRGDPLAVLLSTQALTAEQWLVLTGDATSVVAPALRTTGFAVAP